MLRGTVLSVALIALGSASARADGERTPMFGGSVIGVHAGEQHDLTGVEGEIGMWFGRIGVALEGSQRWNVANGNPSEVTFGGSARLLVFDQLFGSFLEPRDVELGLELHGVVERAWHEDGAINQYGVGLGLRLRGGSDAEFSSLLAESRLFVRVLTSRDRTTDDVVARDLTAPATRDDRNLTVLIGLGAAWGTGERRYVDRFRLRPLDTPIALSPLLPQH